MQCSPVFSSEWMRQGPALERLQLSRTTFWVLRRDRILRPGLHYRRVGPGRRSALLVNVPAAELALRAILGS